MNQKISLKKPLVDFIEYYLHIHILNTMFANSITSYEKRLEASINAKKVLRKHQPEKEFQTEEEIKHKNKELIDAVKKEIKEDYYSVKSAELILLYSRFESAITDVVYMYFQKCDASELPRIDSVKYNINDLFRMNKKDQMLLIADLYIQQKTTGIRYGFNRFEATLEPILGLSKTNKNIKTEIFKFSQIRNLLIHKNGVVDKKFKDLFKDAEQKIGSKISISNITMENCVDSIMTYAEDILDRIDENNI